MTVVVWANVNAFSSTKSGGNTAQQYIVFKQDAGGCNFEGYAVGMDESAQYFGVMVAKGNCGIQRGVWSPRNSIVLHQWNQIALIADSTQISMYLNGVFLGNVQTGFPLNYGSRSLYFGRSGDDGWDGYFNGAIDDIRIYNRTLADYEVTALFHEGGWALPPAAPQGVFPSDGATVSSSVIPFLWTRPASPGNPVNQYMLDLAIDSTFTFHSVDSTITDTSKAVTGLSNGQTYWWRVKAQNANGWGPFGEKRTFTLVVTGIDRTRDLPQEFSLGQNYPNPFNPGTIIEYALPRSSEVSLKVFNIMGQEVATLVNGNEEAGYHEVQFDGKNLASGVYFYRLTAGDFVQSKELLLLK